MPVDDMDVDMNADEEELSTCDRQHRKEGFNYDDIASATVEDDGEPDTANF